jgi:hypothetical protein
MVLKLPLRGIPQDKLSEPASGYSESDKGFNITRNLPFLFHSEARYWGTRKLLPLRSPLAWWVEKEPSWHTGVIASFAD